MIRREVTRSGKDKDGDITALCNPNKSWSPQLKDDVILDIDSGDYEYYVVLDDGTEAIVEVVDGRYLRTNKDDTTCNNLDNLLDC